jgi:hypothetical protein
MDSLRVAHRGSLHAFQRAFAAALRAREVDAATAETPEVSSLLGQPGFAVYRNTVLKGCVDALAANYPAVARLVGDEWFRAAAAAYARDSLPDRPTLLHYGTGFAAFLETFGPAAELAYLPGVARLDRFWTEAHTASDQAALVPGALVARGPEDRGRVVLRPHASARWAWFDGEPIFTIWQRNRSAGPFDDSPIEWRGEGALIVRPRDAVRGCPLDRGGCAFLDACAAGRTLADAGLAALAAEPDADLAALGAQLFAAGAFGGMGLAPR